MDWQNTWPMWHVFRWEITILVLSFGKLFELITYLTLEICSMSHFGPQCINAFTLIFEVSTVSQSSPITNLRQPSSHVTRQKSNLVENNPQFPARSILSHLIICISITILQESMFNSTYIRSYRKKICIKNLDLG